jgi:hypothetical protein
MPRRLHVPPFRVLVPSAHDTGKTFAAAVAASYWFDGFDPGLVPTTAPTEKDVIDLLGTEIRLLRRRAGLPAPFIGPRAPEMYDHEDHYAKGYVSRLGQGFQGRHRPRMLFIKDEANDVDALHFITTRTMFDPDLGHAELVIFNPPAPPRRSIRKTWPATRPGTPQRRRGGEVLGAVLLPRPPAHGQRGRGARPARRGAEGLPRRLRRGEAGDEAQVGPRAAGGEVRRAGLRQGRRHPPHDRGGGAAARRRRRGAPERGAPRQEYHP